MLLWGAGCVVKRGAEHFGSDSIITAREFLVETSALSASMNWILVILEAHATVFAVTYRSPRFVWRTRVDKVLELPTVAGAG